MAFLDVLGFRQLIGRSGTDGSSLQRYLEIVSTIGTQPGLEYVLFSDSIVITAEDDSDAFRRMLSACAALLADLLDAEIPLRGAIAYGPFVRSTTEQTGTVVAGRPIIDAYEFEGRQDWIGIMLTPSVVERHPELEGEASMGKTPASWTGIPLNALLRHGQIPWQSTIPHDTPRYSGFSVVPLSRNAKTAREIEQSHACSLAKLRRLHAIAPDPRAQRKYDASISALHNVHQAWEGQARHWELRAAQGDFGV